MGSRCVRVVPARGAVAFLVGLLVASPAAADGGFERPPLQPMAALMLGSELQLDLAGEVTVGLGRFGEWVGELQVPLFYRRGDELLGYGVHGAVRVWPQVLGGAVFLEPNLGLTSGVTDGARELGFGAGLSFGYTFSFGRRTALSAKAGFDVAPVGARGFFGIELLLH